MTFDKKIYYHLANGKRTMDEIRATLNAMQSEEERLLTERVQEINAIRQRDYLAIILALFIGLGTRLIARYFFNKGNAIGSGLKE
jgi:CHASE3 domain sensor protein